jgi:hypothetical protein
MIYNKTIWDSNAYEIMHELKCTRWETGNCNETFLLTNGSMVLSVLAFATLSSGPYYMYRKTRIPHRTQKEIIIKPPNSISKFQRIINIDKDSASHHMVNTAARMEFYRTSYRLLSTFDISSIY